MSDSGRSDYLAWPFYEAHHRDLASRVHGWASDHAGMLRDAHGETVEAADSACRRIVPALAGSGILDACVAPDGHFDVRAICVTRDALAFHSGLADFAFAMQGLGSGAISLFGTEAQRQSYLPAVRSGDKIAAFALSEPDAGSDVASLECSAVRDGDDYLLSGTKTWISNGGIADFYCVFVRTEPIERKPDGSARAKGISAFIVEPGTPGFSITERIEVIAPHPLATLRFDDCRVPASSRIGEEGQGFKVAMATLDVFRSSVAAAANGFARRALEDAAAHALNRNLFGRRLADFQLTQAALAEMATDLEASALLTSRAAWLYDRGGQVTQAAAMAKLTATETAQRTIDRALQMFGGRGVRRGESVEKLYREIRALRIYEGASEVQKLIISRELMRKHRGAP